MRAACTPPATSPTEREIFATHDTSGAIGTPRGICLPHRSPVLSFLTRASVHGRFAARDRFPVTPDAFHGGFAFPMASLYLGGSVDIMPRHAPDLLLSMMAAGEHSGIVVVPTRLHKMFDLGTARMQAFATIASPR